MKWIIKTGGRIDRLIRSMPVLVVLLIAVLFMYLFYWSPNFNMGLYKFHPNQSLREFYFFKFKIMFLKETI